MGAPSGARRPLPPAMMQQLQTARNNQRYLQLKSLCQRALRDYPDSPEANVYLAQSMRELGEWAQSVAPARRGVELLPEDAALRYELGLSLVEAGEYEQGIEQLMLAIDKDPLNTSAYQMTLKGAERLLKFDLMAEVAQRGMQVLPQQPGFRNAYAVALAQMGRSEEAALFAAKTLMQWPSEPKIAELACFCHNYVAGMSRQRVFEVHRNYGRLMSQTAPIQPARLRATPAHGRKLRIGLVSSDLRQHSVGYFVEPFLRHYDRERFHITVWPCSGRMDPVSERLRALVDVWHTQTPAHHDVFAAAIRDEKIDILMDLNGITEGHVLETFYLRGAPLQMTAIGFANTTGVPNMDLRLVDSLTDPAPEADAFATEKLARLDPCFLCYQPRLDQHTPPDRHEAPGGRPVRFCSFNALFKINDPLLRLWARVLNGVPGSTLMIKSAAVRTEAIRENLRATLVRSGIPGDRLDIRMGTDSVHEHLELYQHADIALDTFPYHGTTTTCEALLMGVPVVCLVGDRHASRVGLSLLTNVGVPELATFSPDQHVQAAIDLAHDHERLATYHRTLRQRLLSSALCDQIGYTRRLEALWTDCWQQACARG